MNVEMGGTYQYVVICLPPSPAHAPLQVVALPDSSDQRRPATATMDLEVVHGTGRKSELRRGLARVRDPRDWEGSDVGKGAYTHLHVRSRRQQVHLSIRRGKGHQKSSP